jgi:hypothetical protein
MWIFIIILYLTDIWPLPRSEPTLTMYSTSIVHTQHGGWMDVTLARGKGPQKDTSTSTQILGHIDATNVRRLHGR